MSQPLSADVLSTEGELSTGNPICAARGKHIALESKYVWRASFCPLRRAAVRAKVLGISISISISFISHISLLGV